RESHFEVPRRYYGNKNNPGHPGWRGPQPSFFVEDTMILKAIRPALLCLLLFSGIASNAMAAVSGKNLYTGNPIVVKPGKKGTVLIFLSAVCPCSNSHIG